MMNAVTAPVGKVVGGAAKGVSNASKKIIGKGGSADDETNEEDRNSR